MNQELKQRLIGAVVVTALAAIFIPMLFDDPVDNSGQSVSELVIPATPVTTGEESANKLPTSANQVLKTPDSVSETVVNTEEEDELAADKQTASDESFGGETEAETEEGMGQPVDGPDQPMDEPAIDSQAKSLDAGVVNESSKPVKTEKAVKKPETTTVKQPPKQKPLTQETAIKADKSAVKPAKSGSESGRWYLQAGTFSKKENATAMMETLRKQGLPVTLESTKGLYRLKVGPSLEKKRALEMKAKLDSQKIQSLLIAE
jgi:DedD protein